MVWKFACPGKSVSSTTFQLPSFLPATLQNRSMWRNWKSFADFCTLKLQPDAAAKEWPVEKLWLRLLSSALRAELDQ